MSDRPRVNTIYRAIKPLLNELSETEIVQTPRSLRTWRLLYNRLHEQALNIYEQYPASDLSQGVDEPSSEPDRAGEGASREPSQENDGADGADGEDEAEENDGEDEAEENNEEEDEMDQVLYAIPGRGRI